MTGRQSHGGLLANRAFMGLLTARAVSILGNAQASIALSFAVLAVDGAGLAELSLVLICKEVTQTLLFVFGGTATDRFPRRAVMVTADLLAGGGQLVAAVAVATGTATVPLLAATGLCNGAAFAFFYPAATSAVPMVVDKRDLHQANSLMRLSLSSMSIAGAAGGGALVTFVGPEAGLTLDGITFLVSAALISSISLGRVHKDQDVESFLSELRHGWKEFASRTWLWAIVLQFAIISMVTIGAMGALGPIISNETAGGSGLWAIFLTGESVGLVLGTLISFRFHPRHPIAVVAGAGALLALPPLALAETPSVVPLALTGLLTGACWSIVGVNWMTTLQRLVPAEALGRIIAYDAFGSWALVPVGLVLAPPLSQLWSPPAVLLVGAALIVGTSLPCLLLRDVRSVRTPEAEIRIV